MLTMVFLPRNCATDTGRPSAAEASARVGNASPTLNPRGNGAFRAQIGFGFDWSALPAATAVIATAVSNNHTNVDRMRGLVSSTIG